MWLAPLRLVYGLYAVTTFILLALLAIPVIHQMALAAGHTAGSDGWNNLILGTISSVLAGAVWGDHCSPISDTTVLSSMASGCDHVDHVRTQAPYALGVGILGMLVGDIPTAFGLPPWVSLVIGAAAILLAVLVAVVAVPPLLRWVRRRR